MYAFDYHRPTNLADAAAALSSKPDAKPIAGGQTLLPTMKQRLASPSDLLDLGGISELRGICEDGDGVSIGAMTRHVEVADSALVQRIIPSLAALAGGIGDGQVRNRGTLGGSVANNDPAADYPAAVLALNATVRTSKRTIAADDFFTGMFSTALEPDELIVSIRFPRVDAGAYQKFRHPASRYALVGVYVARQGGAVRVVVTGAGPGVFRASAMERALGANFSVGALDGIAIDPSELNSDFHASAEYRAALVSVMAKRAVAACA